MVYSQILKMYFYRNLIYWLDNQLNNILYIIYYLKNTFYSTFIYLCIDLEFKSVLFYHHFSYEIIYCGFNFLELYFRKMVYLDSLN